MLTQEAKKAIVDSWRLVVPIKETAADLFYRRLFELKPEYRSLFPEDLGAQKRKLVGMLGFVVKSLHWRDEQWTEEIAESEDLFLVVLALGRRHSELYKIPDESYGTVGESLLWTLDYGLGEAFTPELRDAWTEVYGLLAKTMLMGAMASSLGTPMEFDEEEADEADVGQKEAGQ